MPGCAVAGASRLASISETCPVGGARSYDRRKKGANSSGLALLRKNAVRLARYLTAARSDSWYIPARTDIARASGAAPERRRPGSAKQQSPKAGKSPTPRSPRSAVNPFLGPAGCGLLKRTRLDRGLAGGRGFCKALIQITGDFLLEQTMFRASAVPGTNTSFVAETSAGPAGGSVPNAASSAEAKTATLTYWAQRLTAE